MTTTEIDKLHTLNQTLTNVENELLHRRVASQDAAIDNAMDAFHELEAQGHVEICYAPCDDDAPAEGGAAGGDGAPPAAAPEGDEQ
jgi:hypothetical protein